METKRFQMDVSEKELAEMDLLATFAGMKTKRELIMNAMTLYRWAANELLYGRVIGSMDRAGGHVKQLEMPSLAVFAQAAEHFATTRPSDAELNDRAKSPGRRSLREILDDIERKIQDEPAPSDGETRSRRRVG